jgi:hypothetical protein
MVIIQLSGAQVAKIDNRARGGKSPVRENSRRERKAAEMDGRDCDHRIERVNNLVQTVLADLRALQVAARTAGRREVENRVVAIIDGIENTIAED